MQRPSGARGRELILVWYVWGQVPVAPVSTSMGLLLGSSQVPKPSECVSREFFITQFCHKFQGSWTLEEILLVLA